MKKKNNRIFLVSNMYPSERHPRYGVFVKNFERSLVDNGFSFPVKAVLKDAKIVSPLVKIYKYIVLYSRILFYGMFKKNYDLIYVHFPILVIIPLAVLSFLKKRLVLNFHGSDLFPNSWIKQILAPIQRYVATRAVTIVVPSLYFKDQVVLILSVNADKVYVSPSGGVDVNKFYKYSSDATKDLKSEMGIKKNGLVLGFVSNLIIEKGWDTFIKSLLLLKQRGFSNLSAVMIGDGPDRQRLIELIEQYELNSSVTLYTSMAQNKLASYYNMFDIFIFPTIGKESLGLVGLESMACGTPVIGSDFAGLRTYIKHGNNGMLFQNGSYVELAEMIEQYDSMSLSDKNKMSSSAIITANLYNSKTVSEELANHLQGL